MTVFDDDIVKDQLELFDFVKAPNKEREGRLVDVVNNGADSRTREHEFVETAAKHDKPGSYHYADTKRGHWSQASGCSTQSYLNYVHRNKDNLDSPDHDDETKRTFTHGDLIHLWIQGIFFQELGDAHVTIEEQLDGQLDGEYGVAGHVDIVIRDHPDYPNPAVIDIKSTSEFTYYSYAEGGKVRSIPKSGHLMQLMGYMHHIGAEYGALLYYSKRNDHLEEYWVKFNEDLFDEGKKNIINVLEHVNMGIVPELDAEPYLCDPEYCVYKREGLCPGVKESKHFDPDHNRLDKFDIEDPEWD